MERSDAVGDFKMHDTDAGRCGDHAPEIIAQPVFGVGIAPGHAGYLTTLKVVGDACGRRRLASVFQEGRKTQ
jgi:hypothetical protein